jgi:Tol biopolymer transport system component
MRAFIAGPSFLLALGVTTLAAQTRGAAPPPFATRVAELPAQYTADPAVSPDGRWIVLATTTAGSTTTASSSSLIIVPAGGGAIRELVPGSDLPWYPMWFPSGDRIAYTSDRLKGILVSDFDTRDGRLTGSPRRVSVEAAQGFAISPDGNWIVYVSGVVGAFDAGTLDVKIIPANGGTARVLYHGEPRGLRRLPHFSPDGRDIYLSSTEDPPFARAIVRIPVGGGAPTTVLRLPPRVPGGRPSGGPISAEPRFDRILHNLAGGTAPLVVTTFAGETTAVLPGLHVTVEQARFGRDASTLYVVRGDVGAIIRSVSLTSSETHDLSDGKQWYVPLGWSADSRRVFFVSNDSANVLYSATADGRDMRATRIEPVNAPSDLKPSDLKRLRISDVSGDGRHWLLHENGGGAYLYDSQSRQLRPVVDRGNMGGVLPPGGFGFQTIQRVEGSATAPASWEIWVVSLDGSKRLLRRLPMNADSVRSFSETDDDRIAWIQKFGDSTVLMVARGTGAPVRAWTARLTDAIWSPDGKTIAAVTPQPPLAGRPRNAVTFLAVDANGAAKVTGQSATFGQVGTTYWSPDGAALITSEYGPDYGTRFIRIPVNGGATSVILNTGLVSIWNHYTSPDGKYTVFPAEINRPASLWRVDLKAAEAAYARRARGGRAGDPP